MVIRSELGCVPAVEIKRHVHGKWNMKEKECKCHIGNEKREPAGAVVVSFVLRFQMTFLFSSLPPLSVRQTDRLTPRAEEF